MSYSFGKGFRVTCYGQSHSESIGGVIDGIPAGIFLDLLSINAFLQKRRPGANAFSTPRNESDEPIILSGLDKNGITNGAPLAFEIKNRNHHSSDYGEKLTVPRPMHADYPAHVRYGDAFDHRGGGQFSGRMTAVMCFAGAVALQLLEQQGIAVGSHILSVKDAFDIPFDPVSIDAETLKKVSLQEFPVVEGAALEKMLEVVSEAKQALDSVGGIVECAAVGLPVGIGEPIYDSVESVLSQILFSIPAVKGVEFGAGFSAAAMHGSSHNDAFFIKDGHIRTKTNNHGGILGGLTTGMPLILRAAFKPTPSIGLCQQSISFETNADTTVTVNGRHDPCIVMRAAPCVTAACACGILDLMIQHGGYIWDLKK